MSIFWVSFFEHKSKTKIFQWISKCYWSSSKHKGERGVGGGGEEVIWHLGLLFSALASIRWFFLVLVSVKKKKDSSLLFNFKVLKLEKKRKSAGFLQFLKLVLFSLWNHEDTLLHYCYSKFQWSWMYRFNIIYYYVFCTQPLSLLFFFLCTIFKRRSSVMYHQPGE